ncbi:hypothetical protein ACJMK2_025290 [Sinanodonta woodiana]|uniref:SAM domain-containing protein n=1 Tax=Sinanodonta woodiana TaxID=1069815 RepID=A0ABD3XG29_SINWO
MAAPSELDAPYEGSDESSESELLDRSLSVWKGVVGSKEKEKFEPITLDLYTASSIGQYEWVKALIIRGGVDFDARNKGGWTALMYACYIGHDNIVKLLLEAGANVKIRNNKGETPLMLAASCGNESVGYYLCRHEAELEARDKKGWTALFHSTYSGHQNMVRFLLEQGANMNAVEQSAGMTPFMEAAAEGHEIIVQLFLQHGVNVNAKAYNGDTARSLALTNGDMKIVSLIDNHVMPITSLRSEPGLDAELSSSDESTYPRSKHVVHPRTGRHHPRGSEPSIHDGPEAIARLIDRTHNNDPVETPNSFVPKGYVTFPNEVGETGPGEPQKISHRDVTSPINPQDCNLDSSGGKESCENEEDSNAFSKTGALTIKSSSGSSGGLAAAFGISRENSLDSDDFPRYIPGAHTQSWVASLPEGSSRVDADGSSDGGFDEPDQGRKKTSVKQGSKLEVESGRKKVDVVTHDKVEQVNSVQYESGISNISSRPQSAENPQTQGLSINNNQTLQILENTRSKLEQIGNNKNVPSSVFSDSSRSTFEPNIASTPKTESSSKITGSHPAQVDFIPSATLVNSFNPHPSPLPGMGSSIPPPPGFHVQYEQYQMFPPLPVSVPSASQNAYFPEPRSKGQKQPQDLASLLEQQGLSKYYKMFEEQDVDLQVFLSLTDNDLKEIGIKLFGPRKKMTNAITRWHGSAPTARNDPEQAYADRLESEMQEMAVQLHQAVDQIDKLKAQVKQEQQLRSVTESCLMEERTAWQHVQRIVMDTRQQCEELREAHRKLRLTVYKCSKI